jgi:hypothetical protein
MMIINNFQGSTDQQIRDCPVEIAAGWAEPSLRNDKGDWISLSLFSKWSGGDCRRLGRTPSLRNDIVD